MRPRRGGMYWRMEAQTHTDPQISPRHRTRPLQSPLGPAPPRPADSHKHTPTPPISPRHRTGLSSLHSVLGLHGRLSPTHNAIPTTQRTRGATAPEDPSSEAATKTKETACHGTRSTEERRIDETINPASPKPTNRPCTSGGNHLVPIILSRRPNNQLVRIVRATNQSKPNKPSSALPVGTTWCHATTNANAKRDRQGSPAVHQGNASAAGSDDGHRIDDPVFDLRVVGRA